MHAYRQPYISGAFSPRLSFQESLRPFIIGAAEAHYDYQISAPDMRAHYIETVLNTTFSRFRCANAAVLTLHKQPGVVA